MREGVGEGALGTHKLFTQQFWWGSGIGLRGHWQHNLLFACSLSDCPRRVSSQELRQRHTESKGSGGEEEKEERDREGALCCFH